MTGVIIGSSLLIVLVAVLRRLLRERVSARLIYALWGLVLLRALLAGAGSAQRGGCGPGGIWAHGALRGHAAL